MSSIAPLNTRRTVLALTIAPAPVLLWAGTKVGNRNEWDSLGDEFEKREHQLFGKEGFQAMVDKVAGLERTAGLYDLAQFTPR